MSYPNPTSGGPPLRALAMVLIALAIVFAGLGAMSLSNSDADTDASGTSETPTSSASAAPQVPASTTAPKSPAASSSTLVATGTPTTTAAPTTSTAARSVPVRVLNNSMVPGLAAKTADQLSASGWTIAETGNYPGANIAKTTVYYGNSPGDKEAAQAVADELGASVAPKSSGIGDSGPGVTVIVTGN
ncbi:LytR C-terminal domain-containing protein [Nocardia abscessus]|uniref:LytR C-terminal domain-containing protein n=1 Tax=Nocardia TaxID=1817 RepID=UPI001895C00A|nr:MULTISPECIES: LytR C-terminal domain-containing protein [Nocardia]MBF6218859.1 LytR C-terminal domain-containing protein [Nocardia abscessus]MDE1668785.1 LytR C-terminal domain-containing protein [Nocardia gipuzkoensis]